MEAYNIPPTHWVPALTLKRRIRQVLPKHRWLVLHWLNPWQILIRVRKAEAYNWWISRSCCRKRTVAGDTRAPLGLDFPTWFAFVLLVDSENGRVYIHPKWLSSYEREGTSNHVLMTKTWSRSVLWQQRPLSYAKTRTGICWDMRWNEFYAQSWRLEKESKKGWLLSICVLL